MSQEIVYTLLRRGIAQYCPNMLPLFPERPGRDEVLTSANILNMKVAIRTAMQLQG